MYRNVYLHLIFVGQSQNDIFMKPQTYPLTTKVVKILPQDVLASKLQDWSRFEKGCDRISLYNKIKLEACCVFE